jgi:hypothetical protein
MCLGRQRPFSRCKPFIAASVTVFLIAFLVARPILGHDHLEQRLVAGFALGVVGSVVLYAQCERHSEVRPDGNLHGGRTRSSRWADYTSAESGLPIGWH